MGTNPNLTFRKDLTDFAFSIMPDYLKVLAEAKRIAPIVATGALAGRYASFNTQLGFVAPSSKRAVGGVTADAKFAASMTDFVLDPNALKISVDNEIEVPMAGDNIAIVEESKVTTLLAQGTNSFAQDVYTVLKAGASAHATYGKWGDAAIDPIAQIDNAGLEIAAATGIYPNVVDITPQMLQLLRANPNTAKRFPGVSGGITLDMISACLSFPCTINIITGMGLTGGGFGNSSATYAPLLGTSCWIYYSNPLATGLNASFAITLSQTRELISGVYEYTNDDGTLRFFRIKWACKSVVQSASLARRIDKIA